MNELIGKTVIVRDSTGYSTEGVLQGLESGEGGIWHVVLADARQVNWVDAEQDPPKAECWDLPGKVRIALHLTVGVHETHLAPRVTAPKKRRS